MPGVVIFSHIEMCWSFDINREVMNMNICFNYYYYNIFIDHAVQVALFLNITQLGFISFQVSNIPGSNSISSVSDQLLTIVVFEGEKHIQGLAVGNYKF